MTFSTLTITESSAVSPIWTKVGGGIAALVGAVGTYKWVNATKSISDNQERQEESYYRTVVGIATTILLTYITYSTIEQFTPNGKVRRALKMLDQVYKDPTILLAEAYQEDLSTWSDKLNILFGGMERSTEKLKVTGNNVFATTTTPVERQLQKQLPLLKAEDRLDLLFFKARDAYKLINESLQEELSEGKIARPIWEELRDRAEIMGKVITKLKSGLLKTMRYGLQKETFQASYKAVKNHRKVPDIKGTDNIQLDFTGLLSQ